MLVEFRVKNYRSFRDEQTLSMVASNDKKTLPDNCMPAGKLRLLKSAGIYGPNASGKSNLIKALSTMKIIVSNSANQKPESELPIEPFFLDDNLSKEPSSFEVIFYYNDVRYQYGFTTTRERIHDEWLFASPEGRSQLWFQRIYDEKKDETEWKFGSFLKGDKQKIADKTRNNSLFTSVGAQWNNEQLTQIYKWFNKHLAFIAKNSSIELFTAMLCYFSSNDERLKNKLTNHIIDLLRKADFGISNINVTKKQFEKPDFPDKMPNIIQKDILFEMEKSSYDVKFTHQNIINNKNIEFPLLNESDGTQRFFHLIGPILDSIASRDTLIIDELEESLHPLLAHELIKYFQNSDVNQKGSQLIFATHDTTLMNSELLRRDQIWFTEKDKYGATQLYPLSDYKPRKNEALQRGYLSGRYGAIPILEEFGLDG
ncbi:MAG: ATP-binding protein [candidate division Zixibacteria bacterium]|nr:ATP-binding protein [candidate division Zixibacteria bacterium]